MSKMLAVAASLREWGIRPHQKLHSSKMKDPAGCLRQGPHESRLV
jgi:hypothetical protein